jgi:hypothetical protein
MATAADIPTSVTVEVATTEDAVVMVGTGAMDGTATAVGTADIGAILSTVTDGDWVLALAGRIGVGETRMVTATALGITLPTLTTTHIIVVRETRAFPMVTATRRQRTPGRSPGTPQHNLRDLKRRALLTRMTGVVRTPRCRMVRSSRLTG